MSNIIFEKKKYGVLPPSSDVVLIYLSEDMHDFVTYLAPVSLIAGQRF